MSCHRAIVGTGRGNVQVLCNTVTPSTDMPYSIIVLVRRKQQINITGGILTPLDLYSAWISHYHGSSLELLDFKKRGREHDRDSTKCKHWDKCFHVFYLISSLQKPYKIGIINPIVQMKNLKFRELEWFSKIITQFMSSWVVTWSSSPGNIFLFIRLNRSELKHPSHWFKVWIWEFKCLVLIPFRNVTLLIYHQ